MQPAKQPEPAPAPPSVQAGPVVPVSGPPTGIPDLSRTKPLGDQILGFCPSARVNYLAPRRLKVTVPAPELPGVATFARDTLGFDHLNVVGGTDYLAQGEFEVVYCVGSVSTPGQEDLVLILAERVKREESPSVPSLVPVWTAAEYHERETFEMLGIRFEGHPDLRRLLLPEDWNDKPPLRKDYTSPGR